MKDHLSNFYILLLLTAMSSIGMGRSNIDIIDSLTIAIIEDEVIAHNNSLSDSIIIKLVSPDQEDIDYLTIILGNVLSENSFNVYRNYSSGLSFQGIVLEVIKFAVEVTYTQSSNARDRDQEYVNRKIVVGLAGQIYDVPTGKILKSVTGTRSYSDEIIYQDIEMLENSPYSFTRGKRGEYTHWEKWIEPVIVVTSVAVVAFLFFNIRT